MVKRDNFRTRLNKVVRQLPYIVLCIIAGLLNKGRNLILALVFIEILLDHAAGTMDRNTCIQTARITLD